MATRHAVEPRRVSHSNARDGLLEHPHRSPRLCGLELFLEAGRCEDGLARHLHPLAMLCLASGAVGSWSRLGRGRAGALQAPWSKHRAQGCTRRAGSGWGENPANHLASRLQTLRRWGACNRRAGPSSGLCCSSSVDPSSPACFNPAALNSVDWDESLSAFLPPAVYLAFSSSLSFCNTTNPPRNTSCSRSAHQPPFCSLSSSRHRCMTSESCIDKPSASSALSHPPSSTPLISPASNPQSLARLLRPRRRICHYLSAI